MALWGRSILGFRRRFHQGPAKVSPRRQVLLALPKGSAEGFTNVPLRFHQGSAKVSPKFHHGRFNEAPQSFAVSLVLCRADPSWAAKRFRGRFHRGSSKILHVSWCPCFSPSWAAKGFCGRFPRDSTKVL